MSSALPRDQAPTLSVRRAPVASEGVSTMPGHWQRLLALDVSGTSISAAALALPEKDEAAQTTCCPLAVAGTACASLGVVSHVGPVRKVTNPSTVDSGATRASSPVHVSSPVRTMVELFPQKESPPCCILCGRMRQDGSGGSEGFWAAAGGETPSITSTSLVSNLPRLEVEKLKKDDWTANLGLLNIILSFLFMKGNDAKESPGWELLRRPRVDPGMRHEVFGDVNKLVTEESLRQKYLEYNRIPHTDPSKFEFQMQILGFVAKIQNKDLTAWSTKYTELAAEEAAVGGPGELIGAGRVWFIAGRKKEHLWVLWAGAGPAVCRFPRIGSRSPGRTVAIPAAPLPWSEHGHLW
uniref:MAGE domain-containing protein n=1 Tax=Gopherus evgoodei TaxID=1825980 RepID=A0A8C4YJI2_9SAUR